MNQNTKTPIGVTLTLVGGFVLGAVCTAGVVVSGGGVSRASAGTEIQVKPRLMAATSTESLAELHNLDASFRNLAKFVGPAVVDIVSESDRSMAPNGQRMPAEKGEGSGFLFTPSGYIATNDHVVGTAKTVTVTLKDGRVFQGKVTVANDANSDIALVKIEGKDLPYLSFADETTVQPGEFAMAIGAPFGLENSVTVGHVSALGRANQIGNHVYTDLIQTDAAINMGNSGGPLVNVDGQVIGMNTAIYSPTGGSNGIGFAIPGSQVRLIENLLMSNGKVTRSMLGIYPEDLKEYERTGSLLANGGARVKEIVGEPAKSAGLQKDDVIVKIGSTDIRDQADLRNAMLAYAPGSSVPVEYIRNGKRQSATVKLLAYKLPKSAMSEQPEDGGQGGQGSPFGNTPGNPFGHFFNNPFGNGQGDPFGDQNNGGPQQPQQDNSAHTGQAHLGVQVGDVTDPIRGQYNIPSGTVGAVVAGVVPGSVADRLGLQTGDVITSFNGKAIHTAKDLTDDMKGINWGASASIKANRYSNGGTSDLNLQFTFK